MAVIRQIKGRFVSAYVKPKMVARTVKQLMPDAQSDQLKYNAARRAIDRRCGRDRRQQDQAILINLRTSHARRKNGRRGSEDNTVHGIDIYA